MSSTSLSLIEQYQREIDGINSRLNQIVLEVNNNYSSNNGDDYIPGYLILIFVIIFGFIIFLLTKLEWKTNK